MKNNAPDRTKIARKNSRPANLPDIETDPAYCQEDADAVGCFVRRSAARIAADIVPSLLELRGLIITVDGDCKAGLHDLRDAAIRMNDAFKALHDAIRTTTVRGE